MSALNNNKTGKYDGKGLIDIQYDPNRELSIDDLDELSDLLEQVAHNDRVLRESASKGGWGLRLGGNR